MMMTTKQELTTIMGIAKRADADGLLMFDRMSLYMDIQNVHETTPLRLDELLTADEANFHHDIVGIQNNFNRESKELENHFLPRFAV